MTNKISVYSVEKNSTTVVFEEKGCSTLGWCPFPSEMLSSTAFKTHYFKLSTKPIENHPEGNNEQRVGLYVSVSSLNFGNKDSEEEKSKHL